MPYIMEEDRISLETRSPTKAGELNYKITKLLFSGLSNTRLSISLFKVFNAYVVEKGMSYQTFNDIIGAATGAVFEHTRRKRMMHPQEVVVIQAMRDFYSDVVGPYENSKIAENGDIPGYETQQN